MKSRFWISIFLLIYVLGQSGTVFASTTDGTINSTNKYARIVGTVGGYINFGTTNGNVHVTDDGLTGYAWGENIGWVNLDPAQGGVDNDGEGELSGYAWGEKIGWVNFSPTNGGVSIDDSGNFSGWAWGERIGWISFNCSTENVCGSASYKVATDWRPESVRNAPPPEDDPGPGPGGGGPDNPPPPPPPPGDDNPPGDNPPPPPPGDDEPPPGDVPPDVEPPGPPPIDTPGDTPGTGILPPIIDGILPVIISTVETGIGEIQKAREQIQEIYDDPTISTASKVVTTAGIIVAGGVAASSIFLTALSLSEIFLVPLRLWALIMSFLGLRKKSRPWGTVYDSITKQPLDPAYVVLRDPQGQEIDTSITDLDGRYGFLAGQGTYTLIANKTNYTFPSKRLFGKLSDELYTNLYFGEPITTTAGAVISRNIPLDPEHFDWNEFAKSDKKLMKFYSKRNKFLLKLTDWMYRIGFIVALIAFFAVPEPYNFVIMGIYILLFILRKIGLRPKAYGSITERLSGDPLSFAIIRVINPVLNTEISHKVADKLGHYYCLVPRGTYTIRVERKNPDESYTVVAEIPNVLAKKGIINQTFEV